METVSASGAEVVYVVCTPLSYPLGLCYRSCLRASMETVSGSSAEDVYVVCTPLFYPLGLCYSSCLRASMETVSGSGAEDADTHRQLLSSMEMVWNLCEIVLIDQKRGESTCGRETPPVIGRSVGLFCASVILPRLVMGAK